MPAATASGWVAMITRKPCSSRVATSSALAVIPHGTSNSRQAASTIWIAFLDPLHIPVVDAPQVAGSRGDGAHARRGDDLAHIVDADLVLDQE